MDLCVLNKVDWLKQA